MSIQAVAWALDQDLPARPKLVLVSIANHASHTDGYCWLKAETIAQEAACTPRSVYTYIGGLVRTGPYANRDDEVIATWRRGIAAVAACPNVAIKLGGMGMPRTGFDWHSREKPVGSEELAAAMRPLFSYHVMYNAFKRLSESYSATERAQMFHDTAVRIYRVPV